MQVKVNLVFQCSSFLHHVQKIFPLAVGSHWKGRSVTEKGNERKISCIIGQEKMLFLNLL